MYEESNDDGRCTVHVTCDHPNCGYGTTIIYPTHEQAQWELYRLGWRLHRHKQLCPKHAEIVAKRLQLNRF